MKYIFLSILIISYTASFAQRTIDELEKGINALTIKVKYLESANHKLTTDLGYLNFRLSGTYRIIDSLKMEAQHNANTISQTNNELGIKISTAENNTNQKITAFDNSLSKSSLFGIIGVLSSILLSGILYFFLSKRQKIDKTDFIEQLNKTKSSIEENLVNEFGKHTVLLASQLSLIEQQKSVTRVVSNVELDHSLALKVANEINLIERNINLMDNKVKGLKQLQGSVTKLKDNLSANGYEIPILLGTQFNQGMKVIVTSSVPDENLQKGSEIISKILIPQVNYNDRMIQTAQIEVSIGI